MAKRPRTSPAADSLPLPRGTTDALADLGRRYPEWAARFAGDEPAYPIPLPAVECLALPAAQGVRPLFDPETADAERAFTRLCEANHIVGVHADGPIAFPLLAVHHADISPAVAAALNWTPAQLETVHQLMNGGDDARRRLRGVIGWLLTEPAFLAQVADVRRLYDALPPAARPRFPLGRLLLAPGAGGGEPFRAFADGLVRLLDRWGLATLAAWDLPDPQGPLLPNYLPPGAPARPAHGVWVYVPVHYPLQGDDAIQQQVIEFQRRQVAELGIDPSFAGNTHHETYERMFRVLHLERAVRRRFAHPPRGLAGQVEAATAAAIHLSVERVQRLRKMIAACLAGKRANVKALRARA